MRSKLIVNRKRAKQLSAFDDLQWGKCRPTDIDFSVDFQSKCFVFGELKGATMALTTGQKIHLEGLVKAIRAGGKEAYAFLAHHDTPDTEEDIHVANARVDKYYDGTSWTPIDEQVSVVEFINKVHEDYQNERGN